MLSILNKMSTFLIIAFKFTPEIHHLLSNVAFSNVITQYDQIDHLIIY